MKTKHTTSLLPHVNPLLPNESFTLTITYVFMNLFIGVILDGFDAASASDHDIITQDDFARFANHWAQFDPRATCLISVQVTSGLLGTFHDPMLAEQGRSVPLSRKRTRQH